MADDDCPAGTTHMLVTCGKATQPPHKDEKNPGTCSRVKGFCVPPVPDWTCWQHGKSFSLVKKPRHFKDCADAVATFKKEKIAKKYDAKTQPALSSLHPSKATFRQSKGVWTASYTVTWSVDASNTVVTIPDISWDNMTAADIAAVQRVSEALQAHEEGHVAVADKYAKEISGETVSATGASQQAALTALEQALADHTIDVGTTLTDRGDAYDDLTAHGEHQSNIKGGMDVTLDCP